MVSIWIWIWVWLIIIGNICILIYLLYFKNYEEIKCIVGVTVIDSYDDDGCVRTKRPPRVQGINCECCSPHCGSMYYESGWMRWLQRLLRQNQIWERMHALACVIPAWTYKNTRELPNLWFGKKLLQKSRSGLRPLVLHDGPNQ